MGRNGGNSREAPASMCTTAKLLEDLMKLIPRRSSDKKGPWT